MGTDFLSIQIHDRLAGYTVETQFHLLSLPIHRQCECSLIASETGRIDFKALHGPLSRNYDRLPVPPVLFLFIKTGSRLFIEQPRPV